LHRRAVLALLGVPGRVADDAARPEPREVRDRLDRPLAVHRHERRVRHTGQLRQGGEAGDAAELRASRMDGPDLSGVPERAALLDGDLGGPAADHRQAARVQEPLQARVVGHGRLRRREGAAANG
jgi:hypothetical protein